VAPVQLLDYSFFSQQRVINSIIPGHQKISLVDYLLTVVKYILRPNKKLSLSSDVAIPANMPDHPLPGRLWGLTRLT
jgi:hypothetical protein